MQDIFRIVLEKASSLEEARAFLADYGLTPAINVVAHKPDFIEQRIRAKTIAPRKRAYRFWAPEEDVKLRLLWNVERLPGREIAQKLRRKYPSVRQRAAILGLERRPAFFGTKREVKGTIMAIRPQRAMSGTEQPGLGI
jgi:hypothetical protein